MLSSLHFYFLEIRMAAAERPFFFFLTLCTLSSVAAAGQRPVPQRSSLPLTGTRSLHFVDYRATSQQPEEKRVCNENVFDFIYVFFDLSNDRARSKIDVSLLAGEISGSCMKIGNHLHIFSILDPFRRL